MYPVVCERNKYNGLTTVMITPNKAPYYSFLETNILLTSKSSILNIFCFYYKSRFFYIFVVKIYALSLHSYIQ